MAGLLTRRRAHWRQARIDVGREFVPDTIVATVGQPLRLVFRRQAGSTSVDQVVFPALGRSAGLPPGEDVPFELVPAEEGEFEFSCRDGLLRGRLLVTRSAP